MIKCLFFIVVFFLGLGVCNAKSAPSSVIEKLKASQQSLVTVKAEIYDVTVLTPGVRSGIYERAGAGVIIDRQTIVTSTHIISGARKIIIIFADGQEIRAGMASVVGGRDFSFLKIKLPRIIQPIEWADSDLIGLGDDIINIGHSDLLKQTISGGHVIGIGRNSDPAGIPSIQLIETDIRLYKGDSGGPILDQAGRLLGIITARHQKNRKTTSYAIPSNIIRLTYLEYLKK